MSTPVPWGGVRPLGANSWQGRHHSPPYPPPVRADLEGLWRRVQCDCTRPMRAGLCREKEGPCHPALPAKARDTVHHEPHPPPLLRLCGEVADAQEQRQPHGRGGEHLLP